MGICHMLDRPRSNLAVALPLSGSGRRPRRLRVLRGWLCPTLDLLALSGTLLGVAILPALLHGDGRLASLLLGRISLRNLLLACMCIGTWFTILTTVGVYAVEHTRSLPDYIFRCFVGLNSCAAVVGLVQVVLHRHADVWRLVAVYWVVCLALMTAIRIVLLAVDRLRVRGPWHSTG
jgi:hypothetical protein